MITYQAEFVVDNEIVVVEAELVPRLRVQALQIVLDDFIEDLLSADGFEFGLRDLELINEETIALFDDADDVVVGRNRLLEFARAEASFEW